MKRISILKIGIYMAIAGMVIELLINNTNGLLVCGFSLIALLLLNLKNNPHTRKKKEVFQKIDMSEFLISPKGQILKNTEENLARLKKQKPQNATAAPIPQKKTIL